MSPPGSSGQHQNGQWRPGLANLQGAAAAAIRHEGSTPVMTEQTGDQSRNFDSQPRSFDSQPHIFDSHAAPHHRPIGQKVSDVSMLGFSTRGEQPASGAPDSSSEPPECCKTLSQSSSTALSQASSPLSEKQDANPREFQNPVVSAIPDLPLLSEKQDATPRDFKDTGASAIPDLPPLAPVGSDAQLHNTPAVSAQQPSCLSATQDSTDMQSQSSLAAASSELPVAEELQDSLASSQQRSSLSAREDSTDWQPQSHAASGQLPLAKERGDEQSLNANANAAAAGESSQKSSKKKVTG